jgi:hypothetical protein
MNKENPNDNTRTICFGEAIEALKTGQKVFRSGWNGKNMWLILISGDPTNQSGDDGYGGMLKIYDELEEDMELLPWIGMKTADGKFVPWLASQTDILACDWKIISETE